MCLLHRRGENVACSLGLGPVLSPVSTQMSVAFRASIKELINDFPIGKLWGQD